MLAAECRRQPGQAVLFARSCVSKFTGDIALAGAAMLAQRGNAIMMIVVLVQGRGCSTDLHSLSFYSSLYRCIDRNSAVRRSCG